MFSFFRRKAFAKRAIIALTVLFILSSVLAGCKQDDDDDDPPVTTPQGLRGTWDEVNGYPGYEMEIAITATTYTDVMMGYTGAVVNIRKTSADAGYITIRFTEIYGSTSSSDHFDIGRYYVISYNDLISSTSMGISGAYVAGDSDFDFNTGRVGGKATKQEAEAAYTIDTGAFYQHTPFTRRQ